MNGCVMFCFFKQKTAYELRISVWSSDVCSSDLCARVSFDLIYARPGQSLAAWESELAGALAFGTGHLSLYQLTIEPGTRFATLAAKGDLIIPDGDAAADTVGRKNVVTGKSGSVRVNPGGARNI